MRPQALGYLVVDAKNLDDWARYATAQVGMQTGERTAKTLALRMDDRKQRLCVEANGGEGISVFGWEMADAGSMLAMAAQLEKAGVAVTPGPRALADQRRVRELVIAHDPLGQRLEFFHGAEVAPDDFRTGRVHSGFRTGPLGIGHIVVTVENGGNLREFYQEALGFRLSDYYFDPFEACFFHVNPRHHSFAFIATGKRGWHHVMMEHWSFDDVGQGLDLALQKEGLVGVTLGRHCADYVTSFYTNTPSGFMIEHGWGGASIDPDTWVATHRKEGPSLWGHERAWMTPEGKAAARRLAMQNADNGVRKPVQVIEGNYRLNPGVCPWWDGLQGTK